MGLQDFLAAVETQAATDTRLPVGTVFFFGPVELPRHNDPPRVVWVPAGGTYEGPEKGGFNPQQLFTRRQKVEAHCWGVDFATAETISDVILCAAYEVARGVVNGIDHDQGRPDNLQRGWVFLINLDVLLPVSLTADPDTTVTEVALNGEFDGQ